MLKQESQYSDGNNRTQYKSQMRQQDINTLLRIEGNEMKKLGMIQGFLGGLLVCSLILIMAGAFVWKNPEFVAEKATDYIISNYMQDLFKGFPDAYVTRHRNEVLIILDTFTNAAAANAISKAQFKSIGKGLLSALRDKKITWQELDQLLALMKKAAKLSDERMEKELNYYRKIYNEK